MQTPKVTEISTLSAHRREALFVRPPAPAMPAQRRTTAPGIDALRPGAAGMASQDRFVRTW
jgi:hypothetical protein